jgi:hypothetical protein
MAMASFGSQMQWSLRARQPRGVAGTDRTGRCSVTLDASRGSAATGVATPRRRTSTTRMSFAGGSTRPLNVRPRLSHSVVMSGLYRHNAMIRNAIDLPDSAEQYGTAREKDHRFRLLIMMARGPAGALPEAWRSYADIEEARASAREALRNPQVLQVVIVEAPIGSASPLRSVEWVGCRPRGDG